MVAVGGKARTHDRVPGARLSTEEEEPPRRNRARVALTATASRDVEPNTAPSYVRCSSLHCPDTRASDMLASCCSFIRAAAASRSLSSSISVVFGAAALLVHSPRSEPLNPRSQNPNAGGKQATVAAGVEWLPRAG